MRLHWLRARITGIPFVPDDPRRAASVDREVAEDRAPLSEVTDWSAESEWPAGSDGDAEVARLDLDRLSAAVREERVVAVVGPQGTGKTRLVRARLARGCSGSQFVWSIDDSRVLYQRLPEIEARAASVAVRQDSRDASELFARVPLGLARVGDFPRAASYMKRSARGLDRHLGSTISRPSRHGITNAADQMWRNGGGSPFAEKDFAYREEAVGLFAGLLECAREKFGAEREATRDAQEDLAAAPYVCHQHRRLQTSGGVEGAIELLEDSWTWRALCRARIPGRLSHAR